MSKKFLIIASVLALTLLMVGTLVFADYHINITIDGKEIESDVAPQLVQETMTVEITSPYGKFMDGYGQKGMYIKQADEVLAMFNSGTAVILDVRTDALRGRSLINDSMHIPMAQLLDRIDEVPTDKVIAVYCAKNINASYAVTILNMLGYEAYVLEDGMDAWRSDGGGITYYSG